MVEGRLRGVLPSDDAKAKRDGHGSALDVGDFAPDFQLAALIAGVRQTFRLSDHRGKKNVVLAFYPFNWQETSTRQITEYQTQRERVLAAQGEVVGITVESIMNVTAWEREIGPIEFPLCADFWPHGEVSALYGVLQESGPNAGAAQRSIFVVDRRGRLAFQKVYAEESMPPIEEVLQVLETLA